MARFLGRFERYVIDAEGDAVSGASVYVRKQGATVSGDQSGTTPLVVTVDHQGGVRNGDSVAVNNGTTTYAVTAVTVTTITLSGFAGTLSLSDDDRLVPTTNTPTLYNDPVAAESLAAPLTTSSLGLAAGWVTRGFYDVLITHASITSVLIQDHFVAGGDVELRVDAAPYHAKFDNSTDDWQAITNALQDAKAWTGSGAGVGAVVIMPRGTARVSAPLIVPSRVVLRGQGKDATTLMAHSSFTFNGTTDAVVRLGEVADDNSFDCRLEMCEVDANDVASSIGIYSDSINENSGVRDVQVQRPLLKGIFLDTAFCQNWRISQVGISMAATANPASAIGIDIGSGVKGSNAIDGVSIGAYSGSSVVMLAAIRANGDTSNYSLCVTQGHFEECTTGLRISTHNVVGMNLSGLSGVTSVVGIDASIGNVVLLGISKHGATNSFADTARSETCTGDCGFYASGLSSEANYFGLNSSVDNQLSMPMKFNNSIMYRNVVTVASAATLVAGDNAGNYWNVTGTTTITAITPSSADNGRVIVMKFASAGCQVTDDGGVLNLFGDYVSTAGGVLVLIGDGTNWNEVTRTGSSKVGAVQTHSTTGAGQTITLTDATIRFLNITAASGNVTAINPPTDSGRVLYLKVAVGFTVTDGGTLKLNGDFAPTPGPGSLVLASEGTNWVEMARTTTGLA